MGRVTKTRKMRALLWVGGNSEYLQRSRQSIEHQWSYIVRVVRKHGSSRHNIFGREFEIPKQKGAGDSRRRHHSGFRMNHSRFAQNFGDSLHYLFRRSQLRLRWDRSDVQWWRLATNSMPQTADIHVHRCAPAANRGSFDLLNLTARCDRPLIGKQFAMPTGRSWPICGCPRISIMLF